MSIYWLFAFALSPVLLALFCCLRSGVSDIGFLAFASTQRLRPGPLVVVAVLGFVPLGCEVLRFGYRVSFPDASPSFHVPILLPSFSLSSFRGFALSTAVACLHSIGALAPSHLFAAAFFCLFGFGCHFLLTSAVPCVVRCCLSIKYIT